MGDEKCQRCGEVGEDRRNLWMACFYAMEESGVPFDQGAIYGEFLEFVRIDESPLLEGSSHTIKVPVFEDPTGDPDRQGKRRFYMLRVCKACRAEWIAAIQHWFFKIGNEITDRLAAEKVQPGMIEVEGGTPIRQFGATIVVPPEDEKAGTER